MDFFVEYIDEGLWVFIILGVFVFIKMGISFGRAMKTCRDEMMAANGKADSSVHESLELQRKAIVLMQEQNEILKQLLKK